MVKKRRKRKKINAAELDPETQGLLLEQMTAFKAKFGREAGPEDPLFFDPDEDQPVPISEDKARSQMMAAMEEAGIEPALIYAFHRTGLVVSEINMHLLTEAELAEWQAAIDEYQQKLEGSQPS